MNKHPMVGKPVFQPTRFMLPTSRYDKKKADRAVAFIQSLKHTKGVWSGKPFILFPWQEQIIRDIFGTIKGNGYRQFNTAFVEICKKAGKSELAAAIALYMLCADHEEGAEIYGCANDRQQASIVFDVARDMVIFICRLGENYEIREIAYDRWNASMMVQALEEDGYTMIPFGQGFRDMSNPTKDLMRLVLERSLRHNRHPVLRWNIDNVFVRTDPAGNLKIDKEKSTEKVDGAVALVMALDRALKNQNIGSVYDARGLLVL